jgi:hypothetical protein
MGAPLLLAGLLLLPISTASATRRHIFTTLYRPEDAPQWERNLFHPPHSDSPNLPNYTIFTGPRGAVAAGGLAQLELQLGCYGDGPCFNITEAFGIADAVFGGGCESHPDICAAAFAKFKWWVIGEGPGHDGDSHVNITPPAATSAALGERYLGVTMAEWDGGYVWQQQQDQHPVVGSSDSMLARYISFYSFGERFV